MLTRCNTKIHEAKTGNIFVKTQKKAELEKLEQQRIIYRVDTSDLATPIVAIPKKGGSVRLCGDFKVTLNPVLNVDQYPLPQTDDVFS